MRYTKLNEKTLLDYAFHEIKLEQRKSTNPLVDLWTTGPIYIGEGISQGGLLLDKLHTKFEGPMTH
jgi:hypothetical protein